MTTNKAMAGLAVLGLLIGGPGAVYAQLVTNGSFETTTHGKGQLGYNTDATGWSISGGYTFVFTPGTADTTGVNSQYGNLKLWGPGDGSANGLPATSPDGGNFIASDGAFQVAPITQTINGLTVGQTYAVSFDWGAAQQAGFNGATTDQWKVSFGSDTQYTPIASIASHGFSGWRAESFKYTATSGSEVLSFMAKGTPNGVPPFALLDGVNVTAVPEPTAMVSMFAGVIGLGVFARRRARTAKSVA